MSDPQTVLVQELLQAKFDPADHKSFTGDGGAQLTYVEDETVMDRLDLVLGFGNWQVTEATPISDSCVRLTLGIKSPTTGEWTYYTDFGYVTNGEGSKRPSKEPLKEAWTDAFRRVARIVGVARYVYAGEAPAPQSQGQPAALAAPVTADQSLPVAAQPERPPLPVGSAPYQDVQAAGPGNCPTHGTPWRTTKGDGSPAKRAYCSGKLDNGNYCDQRGPWLNK